MMVNVTKCDSCLNSRVIVSETGFYSSCCLSDKKAMDCLMNKEESYIPNPMRVKGGE